MIRRKRIVQRGRSAATQRWRPSRHWANVGESRRPPPIVPPPLPNRPTSDVLPSTASASRVRRLWTWCAIAAALGPLALAIWIVVPAPNRALLPLGVGAPEVGGWLILLALVTLWFAWIGRGTQRLAVAAMASSVVALALAASPLWRFGRVAREAEHSMQVALGAGYLDAIPAPQRQSMRAAPLVVLDLFRGLPSSAARVTRGVPFASPDDVPLTMDVYQPLAAGPHPVLVQIYGGAWQRGVPSSFSEFAQYFAARGYVVFAIDYRHAPRFRFPAQLTDVETALAWIGAHATDYEADTSRLALIGRSAGAHLALLAAYKPGGPRVRAVVDYYGPVDLVRGYREIPSPDPLDIRAIEDALLGGPPESAPRLYRDASPISYVTRPLPPTLLIYGGRDHIVMPRFGQQLADALRGAGTTVVHLEIPWAEHAFDEVPNGPSGQLARYVTERFLAWAVATR